MSDFWKKYPPFTPESLTTSLMNSVGSVSAIIPSKNTLNPFSKSDVVSVSCLYEIFNTPGLEEELVAGL